MILGVELLYWKLISRILTSTEKAPNTSLQQKVPTQASSSIVEEKPNYKQEMFYLWIKSLKVPSSATWKNMQEIREPSGEPLGATPLLWATQRMDQRPEWDCPQEQERPMMETAEPQWDWSQEEEELKNQSWKQETNTTNSEDWRKYGPRSEVWQWIPSTILTVVVTNSTLVIHPPSAGMHPPDKRSD